jgi:hypothetical protein
MGWWWRRQQQQRRRGICTPVFASLAGEPMATTKSPTRAALLLPRVACAAVGTRDAAAAYPLHVDTFTRLHVYTFTR